MATTAGFGKSCSEPGSTPKCWHLHLQVLYQESVFTEEKSRDAVVSCELYRVILLWRSHLFSVFIYLPGTMDLNVIIIASHHAPRTGCGDHECGV